MIEILRNNIQVRTIVGMRVQQNLTLVLPVFIGILTIFLFSIGGKCSVFKIYLLCFYDSLNKQVRNFCLS